MNNSTFDNQNIVIRNGNENDLETMLELFTDTIDFTCREDYETKQREAWRSGADNRERWLAVIRDQYVLVALSDHQIVGFCTLDQGNYIDLLFVHKDYQHKGIAFILYTQIEEEAIRQNQKQLTADVSKTAKSFFEKSGFRIVKEQNVNVKGVDLTNYKMVKSLIF